MVSYVAIVALARHLWLIDVSGASPSPLHSSYHCLNVKEPSYTYGKLQQSNQ